MSFRSWVALNPVPFSPLAPSAQESNASAAPVTTTTAKVELHPTPQRANLTRMQGAKGHEHKEHKSWIVLV